MRSSEVRLFNSGLSSTIGIVHSDHIMLNAQVPINSSLSNCPSGSNISYGYKWYGAATSRYYVGIAK